MKQTSIVVELCKLTTSDSPFGTVEGKEVFRKLSDFVESHQNINIFGISLAGIAATDASFPRESVVSLAKQLRGEKGFFLTAIANKDIQDNWHYAARAKEQPLIVWKNESFNVIGPELNASTSALLEYVLRSPDGVRAAEAAADLEISLQNASTRLKNLVTQGYIDRVSEVADTGGVEYRYAAIH